MSGQKKVLLSAYACSPIRGSEPGNGWSWATGLAERGFQVWCFTNVEDKDEILEAYSKLHLPNLHFVFVELPGILDKYFLDTNSKKIYLHYARWQKKASRIAIKKHAEIKFDIGHHVTFGSLQQGHFLWKLNAIKIIFGPVGGGQKALPLFKEYFGKAWRIEKIRSLISDWSISFSKQFRHSILQADHVLVTNPDTRKMASIKGSDDNKIHFVPDNAIPATMENLSIAQKPPSPVLRLLWVGRMLPRKGLNLVLEALSYLPPDTEYHLTIVGGGELFSHLDGWIQRYRLNRDRILVTGPIPFEQVKDYYKLSDVFIFCSLRDSFPAQLTEAMAFGLPVITLNIHGSAIGVPDNCGIKITPETKQQTLRDIASAITQMADNTAFRNECAGHAREYSKNNTWQNRIDTVVKDYYLT